MLRLLHLAGIDCTQADGENYSGALGELDSAETTDTHRHTQAHTHTHLGDSVVFFRTELGAE